MKMVDGRLVEADGVKAECLPERKTGAFLLPIGVRGGAAKAIAGELLAKLAPRGAYRAQ